MKLVKGFLIAFIATGILAISGVSATSYVTLIGINLPGFSGTYNTSYYSKTIISKQYAKKVTAIDKLSGDERAVSARTYSSTYGYSSWISLPKGSLVNWGESYSNIYTSSYKLQLKLSTAYPTGATFNGYWYLDNLNI